MPFLEILDVILLFFDQRLVYVLREVREEALVNLPLEVQVAAQDVHELVATDCQALHLGLGPVDETVAFLVANLEPTDRRAHSELRFVKLSIVDLETNLVSALLNE
jgi:hypothetical protein